VCGANVCGAISIAFIDLDKFKALNDRAGHYVGDEALCVVAQTLRAQLRSTDVPGAVLGGMSLRFHVYRGWMRGRQVRRRKYFSPGLLSAMEHRGWPITFSIGLATFATAPDSADEMIKLADMLMYQMKREGKGGISEHVFGVDADSGGVRALECLVPADAQAYGRS